EDSRIVVVKTGTFTLRTADTFDAGLYHCIGTNYNDADILTFRITVVDPYVEGGSINGAQLSTFVGSTLYLPCASTAVPEAAISWVLPERVILHHSVRNKHIFDNGTLRIQGVTERDGGYFRCVAANQYGVDLLSFQVLVRKDKTTPKKMHVAVGEWEESDGSGNAMQASATRHNNSSAALATLTANQASAASASRNEVTQSPYKRNSYGKTSYRHYRDKISRRFRGQRRQFVSSARRVDPQRWAAFLEKTKRNSTLIEKQEAEIKPPIQVPKFSKVPVDEEETSGDLISPEQEFMIPLTESTTVSSLGKATESVVTAGPKMTTSNSPARTTSLLVAEAVAPLPSPSSQSVSSDSRRPQTYLNSTVTNSDSWERPDLSQMSANVIKQSAVTNGASRTSTVFSAQQRLVSPGESNNQHLKSVSMTLMADVTDTSKPVTSENTVGELHVLTQSTDKISTKTDHQMPVVTVSEPNPEFGHIYFHSTQNLVTPKLPLGSNIITHQQIQIIQDVTTHAPQAQQQYGRRRKISGRRKIVRPGHILSMREHRYNFGKQGSVGGSTAIAPDVLLNSKYVSDLPTLNNLSSSINPVSPEAPLSSPSTMNVPLEHPAGTLQNTAFLIEENSEPAARQRATSTVMPFITKSTQDTPQQKSETGAPFQTSTYRVQAFSVRLPTTAVHTAHVTAEITHTVSTKISSALESGSPNTNSRTSSKNSQGEITGEHLFGNDTQKEVLKKLPKQQTDMIPSTEVSVVLPKTTAALSMSKISRLHFTSISTGGDHSSVFLSLNKSIPYGNGKSEEHLPTAELHAYSNPAASTTKADVGSLKPTVIPIITPQTDTKIIKSKIFRVGRKRGQRRKRPPKTSSSQSLTAGYSTAAIPPVNTAIPAVTAVKSLTMPPGLKPAKSPSESASAVSVTEMPALWILTTSDAPQHVPTTAKQTSATPITRMNVPSVKLPPSSPILLNPTTTIQTTPSLSKPFDATRAQPAAVGAISGSEPDQRIKATTMAGEQSHPKMEEKVTPENHVAQPTLPGRAEPSSSAPVATTGIAAPSARHPTPLP
ncbi:IGS10 protein, partial [Chauna torquata]|nr:IGS10 protein [Chauna torquata]